MHRTESGKMALMAIFFVGFQWVNAQSSFDLGKDAFYQNRFDEAKRQFSRSKTSSGKEAAESHLFLSLIAAMQGKEADAFSHFDAFFRSAENPYPYTFSLWSSESVMGTEHKKSMAKVKFLHALATDPKAGGTLKAMANSALGDHYAASNQFEKSNEQYAKIGALDKWAMVGEFENISESGFDKVFSPITQHQAEATFINRNGAEVKWFQIPGNRADKWTDFTFHFFAENSILFAQTFVNCPANQEVQIRLGTSGSLKVWLNNGLLLAESEERNNDLDTYIVPAKLQQGQNRLLLQIGASEIERSNFMVRITDSNGDPLPGITHSSQSQSFTPIPPGPLSARVPIGPEQYFENAIRKNQASVLDYLVLAQAYLRNDKGYEARKILAKAEKLAPQSSYLKIQQIEAFNRSGNTTDATIAVDWVKQHDPDNLFSLNVLLNEEVENNKWETANKLLDKVEALYGESESSTLQRISVAAKEGKQELVAKLVNKGYLAYPDNYVFVNLKADLETATSKSQTNALAIVRKFLKTSYLYEAQKSLSDLYFAKGDNAKGLEAYQVVLKNSPYLVAFYYNLGNFYLGARDYKQAEKNYRMCLNISPFIYYFWSALGKTQQGNNQMGEAKSSFQRALQLNPRDGESREKLRQLAGKPEVFTHFPQIKAEEIVSKAPAAEAFPDENSVILLDEVQKVVYKGGISEEKRFLLVKILATEGINRWKQYGVEHYSTQSFNIEKAEVIKANGSKVEASVSYDQIVFSSLEVGDAINVEYKLTGMSSGLLNAHFWDSFYFSHYIPYQTSRYRLLVEQGVSFQHKFSKEPISPIIEKREEFDLYTWEKKDQSALAFEDRMPELADVGNVLSISSIPDWATVSAWYNDLSANKSKINLEVKEAVAKVLEGKANLTEMQKARLIYEHIVSNIKYLSVAFLQSGLIPQKASHVLNTRLGDCKDVSTLFVAMCKEAGLQADLVLIATRNGGKHQMLLPSIDFNHCIARLKSGGKEFYIELTSDKLPFNTFYNNLLNATALNVYPVGAGPTPTLFHLNPPSRNLNLVVRETEMEVKETDLNIRKKSTKTGVYASNMRESYLDLSNQDRMKEMQRAISGDYSQTILKSLKFNGLKGISDTVETLYDYLAPEAVTSIGGLELVNMPWSERAKSTDFNFTDNRQTPIDLWELDTDGEEETIQFQIPKKNSLAEVPKNISIFCPVAEYSLQYQQKPDKLLITRKLRYKKDRVDLSDMKEFESFYRKMVAGDSRQLALKKKPGVK